MKVHVLKVFFCLSASILITEPVFASSSFDELVREVADESDISTSLSRNLILSTFRKITERMQEDKGTSIPDFGRFYVQEKQKSTGKDKDGFTLAPRMVRSPRCVMSRQLKKILENE
jgi:nucleoid DNA-binding protein